MSGERAFVKMHGAGNDFVVIGDLDGAFPATPGVVAALCAAHTGIGADGLILVGRSSKADFRMRYFNRDGGEAGMCGNGARCAARFAFDEEIAGESMAFETNAGIVKAEILAGGKVRIGLGPVRGLRIGLRPGNGWEEAHAADSGVPHAIVFARDARELADPDFPALAGILRGDPIFGEAGANVDLVFAQDRHTIRFRTYERGVEAETLACGTGAVASAVVAAALDLVEPPVACATAGGDILTVDFVPTGEGAEDVFLTGPAVVSFRGEIGAELLR
ncbi:MAG: diaminopimelate epimerase [Candidatus Krumholzibacteriota bacterium]|nr:diaminopimelate epimerase [Candidatus Krumholzibacteriota bacterium]